MTYVMGTPEEEAAKEILANKLDEQYRALNLNNNEDMTTGVMLKRRIAELGGLTFNIRQEAAKNPIGDNDDEK